MIVEKSVEKCFEEAEETGVLEIVQKKLKQFPACVDDFDLLDVIYLDISKNRFSELPQEILSFVMMEKMTCSYNFLRNLPDLSHLNALYHIDIRQNQLQSLPVHLCSLPLKILRASHNHITAIPSEIGLLSKLQALDLSCNRLTNLPSTMGDLLLLGSLNVRRNEIVALPDELSKLKNLMKLDISCNKVTAIPPAFRLISSLIELDLTNNPLSSPPAQICVKGRLHIVKYLSIAAQQQEKRWTLMKENGLAPSPSSSSLSRSNSPIDVPQDMDTTLEHVRVRASTIKNDDSEVDLTDSVNKTIEADQIIKTQKEKPPCSQSPSEQQRPSDSMQDEAGERKSEFTNQALQNTSPSHNEEDVDPVTELVRSSASISKPRIPRKPASFNEKHKGTIEKSESLKYEKHKATIEKSASLKYEKHKVTVEKTESFKTRLPTPTSPSSRLWATKEETDNTQSQLSKPLDRMAVRNLGNQLKSNDEEVSRSKAAEEKLDDLAARKEQLLKNKEEILKSKQRLELIKAKSVPREPAAPMAVVDPSPPKEAVFDGISKRNPLKPRLSNKRVTDGVINFTMRRMFDSAKEEFELLEKLRESIESRLRIKLPDDLPASLSDGIVLCHLVNHLRKGTISIIHVPSSGIPKLTMPKCQMNVDAFLDACRRAGVEKVDVCTAPDILEEKSPTKLCKTVHALLLAMGDAPPKIVLQQQISPR